MEFCVLGPVEAWADGERVSLGPAKVRCVLAVLLRTPGVLVTTEALVDRVWDEHPAQARRVLIRSRKAPYSGASLCLRIDVF